VRLEISWAKPAQVRTLQQSILLILVREVVKGKIIASIFAHKQHFGMNLMDTTRPAKLLILCVLI
jgi:hypothetical protein